MRNLCFIAILLGVTLSSCSVLQWRASDAEIFSDFSENKIKTDISYFKVDSLNLNLRIQEVRLAKNTINLVYLHGSPSSLSAWNGYLKDSLLLNNANAFAIDRPGYGYSNFGDKIPSITIQSQLINSALKEKKLKNIIIIGASYGGPIAARLALLNNNIKGVIMVSPAIDPNHEKKIWASKLTQWWLTRWLIPTAYRVAGDEKTVHAQELKKIEADWSLVHTPVIHIHGNADKLVPYINTEYSKKVFNTIEIVTIPDAGHEISWSMPEQVKPSIFKLINRIKNSY